MKNISNILSIILALACIVLLFLVSSYKNDLTDYIALAENYKKQLGEARNEIDKLWQERDYLNGEITSLYKQISDLDEIISGQIKTIEELKKNKPPVNQGCEELDNYYKRVVAELELSFSLCQKKNLLYEEIIANKDKEITIANEQIHLLEIQLAKCNYVVDNSLVVFKKEKRKSTFVAIAAGVVVALILIVK